MKSATAPITIKMKVKKVDADERVALAAMLVQVKKTFGGCRGPRVLVCAWCMRPTGDVCKCVGFVSLFCTTSKMQPLSCCHSSVLGEQKKNLFVLVSLMKSARIRCIEKRTLDENEAKKNLYAALASSKCAHYSKRKIVRGLEMKTKIRNFP